MSTSFGVFLKYGISRKIVSYNFYFSLAIAYYLSRTVNTNKSDLLNLIRAGTHGRFGLDCQMLYPNCDEHEWMKMQYMYWILPWNPMGTPNLLNSFMDWAYNKDI